MFFCVFLGFGVLLYRGSVVLLFLVVNCASRADMGNKDFQTWVSVLQTLQTWATGLRHMQTWATGLQNASVEGCAIQVRSCGVRFAAGALPALSGQGKHETGRVDSPGAGCLVVGPAQKIPLFGRGSEKFF